MFKFNLKDTLTVSVSGESGECIGRAEYTAGGRTYLVRYCAGDGRAVEMWWNEDALERL